MDAIIQLFQEHVSPEKLQKYRLEWENITSTIVVALSKPILEKRELKSVSSTINQSSFSNIESNNAKNVTVLHETNLPMVTSNSSNQNLDKSIINIEDKAIIETALNDSSISSKASSEIEKVTKLQETKVSTVDPAFVYVSIQDLNELFFSNKVEIIASGSNVEGASMARLFFEDSQREIELDVMYQVAQINRMCLEQCNKSNPMFVHILLEMDPNVINECARRCEEDCSKFVECDNKNFKSYLCSDVLKSEAKFYLNSVSPDLLKRLGGYAPCTVHPEWNSKDAAGTFNIVFSNDPKFTGKRESNPQETVKHVFNEVVNSSAEFEQKAKSMLETLIRIQHNFLESRLTGKTKVEQISLAIEWSNQCLLLTDTLCDHRQETIAYTLRQLIGYETKEMTESIRFPIKKKFENHISKLNKFLEEPNSDESEQILRDFETDAKLQRSITGFDTFLRDELFFIKTVRFAQKEEDSNNNVNELLIFSEKYVSKISIDFVFCLRCNFWPVVAAEWLERERLWPEQATIKNIVTNGIHVVCKELQHSAIDWRLSFSVAEIEIAKLWTTWQHYIYFIFKSLFYKYLKPLSNKGIKVITSYLVKTVMLNVSENFEQSYWCKENAGECLHVLLMTLISAFESKILRHHFIPTFNLLHGASNDEETEQVLDNAADILCSLLKSSEDIPSNLSATFEIIVEFLKVLEKQTEMKTRINDELLPFMKQL